MSGPLGRLAPPDWGHVERYPLAALASVDAKDLRPTHVPVAAGVNWYTAFDTPTQDRHGKWWIGRDGNLGTVRGGHCVCLEPAPDPTKSDALQDRVAWWLFYDQGEEGACEGFGHSRMASILNDKQYDGFWLYHQAQLIDGIPGAHDGTTGRAVLEVMRTQGLVVEQGARDVETPNGVPDPAEGISAYRWATSVDELIHVLGIPPARGWFTLLNSWGRSYPHKVRLPFDVMARLLAEQAELGVVTDR